MAVQRLPHDGHLLPSDLPSRTPRRENMLFYPSAAAALAAGFRPCLRCRPEVAPGIAAWRGTSNTVARALALIDGGALDIASVDGRAARLGVGERSCGGFSPSTSGHRRSPLRRRGGCCWQSSCYANESVDDKPDARSGIPQYQTFQRGLHAVVPPLSWFAPSSPGRSCPGVIQ
jgi:Metal binding domain of Ada